MQATYTKLRDGSWGARVEGNVKAGDTIVVVKRNGEKKQATVDKVVWSGAGVSLCSIVASTAPKPAHASSSSSSSSSQRSVERTYKKRYGWDGVRGSPSYYSSGMYDEES